MLPIITFLSTLWGRGAVIAAAVLAIVALRAADIRHQRAIGASKVVEVSKKEGAKANARNEEIRRATAKPGASDRLLKDPASCRDC